MFISVPLGSQSPHAFLDGFSDLGHPEAWGTAIPEASEGVSRPWPGVSEPQCNASRHPALLASRESFQWDHSPTTFDPRAHHPPLGLWLLPPSGWPGPASQADNSPSSHLWGQLGEKHRGWHYETCHPSKRGRTVGPVWSPARMCDHCNH